MKSFLIAVVFALAFLSFAVLYAGRDMAQLKMPRVDLSPFLAAGCVDNDQAKGFVCPPEVLKRFGCVELKLDDRVGGIDMPAALCVIGGGKAVKGKAKSRADEAVGATGCLLRVPYRYVLYTTKGFKVARTKGEFVRLTAPFDRPEEAASLVMALNPGVMPKPLSQYGTYDMKTRDKKFLESSARAEGDGFVVRLFERDICGCGLHPVFAVDYSVSRDGAVSELSRKVVMEGQQEICVD